VHRSVVLRTDAIAGHASKTGRLAEREIYFC
jgi:hypothetical protein